MERKKERILSSELETEVEIHLDSKIIVVVALMRSSSS